MLRRESGAPPALASDTAESSDTADKRRLHPLFQARLG
jgi:hypothetical protein